MQNLTVVFYRDMNYQSIIVVCSSELKLVAEYKKLVIDRLVFRKKKELTMKGANDDVLFLE